MTNYDGCKPEGTPGALPKVGEITMDKELLYAKIEALEGDHPLAHRRSRR
jgi:hypothetical protein